MNQNGLRKIVRGHTVVMRRYEETHGERIATLFSAANYHNQINNQGNFVKIGHNLEMTSMFSLLILFIIHFIIY